MKRMALLLLAVIFPGILLMGQGEVWMAVPDVSTGVSVEMPGLPEYEQKTTYQDGQYIAKEIFSFRDEKFSLVFEIQRLRDNTRKTINRAIRMSIDHLGLYVGGKPGKIKMLTREGKDYFYVEYTFSNGQAMRSVLFEEKGKLFHIYVKGSVSNSFGIDANYYLGSWRLGNVNADIPVENDTPVKSTIEETYLDTWEKVKINNRLEVAFPGTPFKRTTFIEFGVKDVTVVAYSRYSEEYNMNYVLTHRTYGHDEGQLNDDELYAYILSQISESGKMKLVEVQDVENHGIKAKEYILSKGIRFYKLQLLRLDNSIYQALIKGKRKTVTQPEAIRFFNSIKTLN